MGRTWGISQGAYLRDILGCLPDPNGAQILMEYLAIEEEEGAVHLWIVAFGLTKRGFDCIMWVSPDGLQSSLIAKA